MPKPTTLYLASDHAGFSLKESTKKYLLKYTALDLSPDLVKEDDYPQHAKRIALAMQSNPTALGILYCGSGHGMDIAANRFSGVRAIVARTSEDAKLAREHNHANILVLGGRITSPQKAKLIIESFLSAKPSSATRHIRRIHQLDHLV